jgi:hypothetical protein
MNPSVSPVFSGFSLAFSALVATIIAGRLISPAACSPISCGLVVALGALAIGAFVWTLFFLLEQRLTPEALPMRQGKIALRRAGLLTAVLIVGIFLSRLGLYRGWIGLLLVGAVVAVEIHRARKSSSL